MKVENTSTRLHHIGDVSIAPGEIAEVPAGFEKAINTAELVEVKEGRAAKKAAATETEAAE